MCRRNISSTVLKLYISTYINKIEKKLKKLYNDISKINNTLYFKAIKHQIQSLFFKVNEIEFLRQEEMLMINLQNAKYEYDKLSNILQKYKIIFDKII